MLPFKRLPFTLAATFSHIILPGSQSFWRWSGFGPALFERLS